jgi:hypothetical protein
MNEDQKHDYGVLIAKKSERLVTALYLVSDLMTDNEPIKHGLRKNAVALLSSMNAISQVDAKDKFSELRESLTLVTEILSLLQVSLTTSGVSEMNGKLLIDGFRSLQLVLEKKQPVLTREMLTVEHEDTLSAGAGFRDAITTTSYDAITPRTLARFHSDERGLRQTESELAQARLLTKLSKSDRGQRLPHSVHQQSKGQVSEHGVSGIKDIQTKGLSLTDTGVASQEFHHQSSFQVKKQSRRDQILGLFVKGVDVSIKDISLRIRGCSEKTIQRELNALLEDGFIDRIGEKRWSRYVLK